MAALTLLHVLRLQADAVIVGSLIMDQETGDLAPDLVVILVRFGKVGHEVMRGSSPATNARLGLFIDVEVSGLFDH